MTNKITRSADNAYPADIVQQRQAIIEENTPVNLNHTKHFSHEQAAMAGNIENLFGIAQVPIGLAGSNQ